MPENIHTLSQEIQSLHIMASEIKTLRLRINFAYSAIFVLSLMVAALAAQTV